MYRILIILMFVLSGLTQAGSAQSIDAIAKNIQSANTKALAASFDSNVLLAVFGDENTYSKTQAEVMITKFFEQKKPSSFTIAHSGNSPGGGKFFVGHLITSGGKYRTFIQLKLVNNQTVIREIRFEEE